MNWANHPRTTPRVRLTYQRAFKKHKIDHVILFDTDGLRLKDAFLTMMGTIEEDKKKEWTLLFFEGRTAIFGWREAPEAFQLAFKALRLDLDQRALSTPPFRSDSPATPPSALPPGDDWWRAFLLSPLAPLLLHHPGTDEARLCMLTFESHSAQYLQRHYRNWEVAWASSLVTSPGFGGFLASSTLTHLRLFQATRTSHEYGPLRDRAEGLAGEFMFRQEQGPITLPILAIRACRLVLSDNPQDANAHYLLGVTYSRLSRTTREALWGRQLPLLHRLRTIQAITVLQQAVQLRPNLEEYPPRVGLSGSQVGGFWKMVLTGWNDALISQANGATNKTATGSRNR